MLCGGREELSQCPCLGGSPMARSQHGDGDVRWWRAACLGGVGGAATMTSCGASVWSWSQHGVGRGAAGVREGSGGAVARIWLGEAVDVLLGLWHGRRWPGQDFHRSDLEGHFCWIRYSPAYYPQTDGRSQRVNQCLETYLRCMTSTQPKKWLYWLPLAEYWYNSSYHTAINKSPFEAVYGPSYD